MEIGWYHLKKEKRKANEDMEEAGCGRKCENWFEKRRCQS